MDVKRKLILYISMSLDGYIADCNDDLHFLSVVEQDGEDYGYSEFINSVDTVIIGRKTFDKVKSMGFEYPHTDKEVYIISRSKQSMEGSFQYYNGNLSDLVTRLKTKSGKNIYCDGGAEIANYLLSNYLVDEMIISIIPVLLGDGIRLFKERNDTANLTLLSSKQFPKGLVQLHYSS
ncbi:MAG: dihydrofolate reductase family protein [Bacteroidales bacterium]|nr:dihydrofolate reductase family protein [Bacteroidales bacterium]